VFDFLRAYSAFFDDMLDRAKQLTRINHLCLSSKACCCHCYCVLQKNGSADFAVRVQGGSVAAAADVVAFVAQPAVVFETAPDVAVAAFVVQPAAGAADPPAVAFGLVPDSGVAVFVVQLVADAVDLLAAGVVDWPAAAFAIVPDFGVVVVVPAPDAAGPVAGFDVAVSAVVGRPRTWSFHFLQIAVSS